MWCLIGYFLYQRWIKPPAQFSALIVCATWIECTFQGLKPRAAA